MGAGTFPPSFSSFSSCGVKNSVKVVCVCVSSGCLSHDLYLTAPDTSYANTYYIVTVLFEIPSVQFGRSRLLFETHCLS